MVSKRLAFWAALVVIFWAGPIFAGGVPEEVRITQLSPLLPTLRIYAQFLDEGGNPVDSVSTDRLTVRIDGGKAKIRKVAALAQDAPGVAYTLLVDISRTVSGGPLEAAVRDMQAFVGALGPDDHVAIGTFGDQYTLVLPFTKDKDAIREALSAIQATDGLTVFYSGLIKALEMNKVLAPDLPVRRAIVAVTDGKDEGSGLTLDDILERNRQTAIPIYTVGYTRIQQKHLFGLKRLAELTGGLSLVGGEGNGNPFSAVAEDRDYGLLIEADCGYEADGGEHLVQVLLNVGDKIVSAERTVSYLFVDDQALAKRDRDRLIYGGIAGGMAVLLILLMFLVRRKKRNRALLAGSDDVSPETEPITPHEDPEYGEPGTPADVRGDTTVIEEPDAQEEIVRAMNDRSENRLNPNCELVIMSDPDYGKRFQLYVAEEGITVGAGACALRLSSNQLDDVQLGLFQINQRFLVKPLSSDVRTHLNGIPLTEQTVLEHNDVIEAGTLRMRFLSLMVSDA